MALIEIRDLKKYFNCPGGVLHAVDGVSLDIEEGTTLGVVGESGCGKSTLGKTIMRLIDPTSGQIFFDGIDIAALSQKEFDKIRYEIQMIFQDPYASLDPRMTVQQLIAEPLLVSKSIKSKVEIQKRVSQLMEQVGLAQRLENSHPHELDGGRRQRIGIARALALKPRFIICDEPVSALDVSIQAQMLNLLQDLQEKLKLTYIFITHDMSVVKHISTEIAVMYLGQVVEKCETSQLFSNTLHPYSQALLSAIPSPNIHKKRERILLKGELASPINPKKACRFAPRCIHAKEICFSSEPKLEAFCPNHLVACHRIGELAGSIHTEAQ